MPAPGRSTDPRTIAGVGTTSTNATLTGTAGSFDQTDVGRTVTGTGIPAGRTITAVNAAGSNATMSGNASATGTTTVTVGAGLPGTLGFLGWSPETGAEAGVLTVAQRNAGAPDHNRTVRDTRLDLKRNRT
jgi:hypothetical protein